MTIKTTAIADYSAMNAAPGRTQITEIQQPECLYPETCIPDINAKLSEDNALKFSIQEDTDMYHTQSANARQPQAQAHNPRPPRVGYFAMRVSGTLFLLVRNFGIVQQRLSMNMWLHTLYSNYLHVYVLQTVKEICVYMF